MKKIMAIILALTLLFAFSVTAYADNSTGVIGTVIDYGWVLFAALVCIAVAVVMIVRFCMMPGEEQLIQIREWLLWAVMKAEQSFGAETGKLKLHFVYDLFVSRFPWAVKLITFERFAELVDDALDEMKKLLEENPKIAATIETL